MALSFAEKVVLLSLGMGAFMGVATLAAAAAAGRSRIWPFGLGGTVWGILVAGLALSDCWHSGSYSAAAYPVYFLGALALPVLMAWGQRLWALRWAVAQAVLLLTAVPAFVVAVMGALCTIP